MPAKSKAQQRFFGMVRAAQKGELENPSKAVQDAADSMSKKEVKKFAKTKHKGLPNHVKKSKANESIVRLTEQDIMQMVSESVKRILSTDKKYPIDREKALIVSRFLSSNFKKGILGRVGADGMPESVNIVAMVDKDGNVLKNMYLSQLVDLLVDKYYNMFNDKEQLENFMEQIAAYWYADKIDAFGGVPTNFF